MSFIQIIEARTKNFDELKALDDHWEQATEGKRTSSTAPRPSTTSTFSTTGPKERNDGEHDRQEL